MEIHCRVCEFIYDDDIAEERVKHKSAHNKAVAAQEALKDLGPCELPISSTEWLRLTERGDWTSDIEQVKYEIWAEFAQSLAAAEYDLEKHPIWPEFARTITKLYYSTLYPDLFRPWTAETFLALMNEFGIEPPDTLLELIIQNIVHEVFNQAESAKTGVPHWLWQL